MIAITGTPGTGKSETAAELRRRGYRVISAKETMDDHLIGRDDARDTMIVDEEAWAASFEPVDGFVEGHLTHLLHADRVVVLRCRPDRLRERLAQRGYSPEKIRENVEAEVLDAVLIETLEWHEREDVLEIDTTDRSPADVADEILRFIHGERSGAAGTVDWSPFLEMIL
ncbi:MAG: adenylate kinase family protein [Methanoculleaceae archaeon]